MKPAPRRDKRDDGKNYPCPKCGRPHANQRALDVHKKNPKLCALKYGDG